jgi:hypothetical protein
MSDDGLSLGTIDGLLIAIDMSLETDATTVYGANKWKPTVFNL